MDLNAGLVANLPLQGSTADLCHPVANGAVHGALPAPDRHGKENRAYRFDGKGAYPLDVPEGSAAEQAAALLPESTVVAAFHHVSAVLLLDPGVETLDTDVLVLGDERSATDAVQDLVAAIPGMRGICTLPITTWEFSAFGTAAVRTDC